MKRRGFTLQELLIAIAIIGLISILVFPKVFDDMNKKTKVASFQRTYLSIAEAVRLLMIDEHATSIQRTMLYTPSNTDSDQNAKNFLKARFKITHDCETTPTPCFAQSYKSLDNSKTFSLSNSDSYKSYCVTLSSRASVCLKPANPSGNAEMLVDTNGSAGPNTAGRDFFKFYIYNDGYVGDRDNSASACLNSEKGEGCVRYLIEHNWTMDY